ncbi:MAG: formate dehydrogenase [Candidatus Methylomirabilales bacterium]
MRGKKEVQADRRKFLLGLLGGAGVVATLAATKGAAKAASAPKADSLSPILYRRTEHVEKYYRTLEL